MKIHKAVQYFIFVRGKSMQLTLKHKKIEESQFLKFCETWKEKGIFNIFHESLKFHEIFHVKLQDFIFHEILPPPFNHLKYVKTRKIFAL